MVSHDGQVLMNDPPEIPEGRRWLLERFSNSIRQLHLDFHTPDQVPDFLSRFDPWELARQISDAGVQAVTIFGKCHYGNSYYFTTAGRRHPQLQRDMLAEFASALRQEGLMVICYYSTLCDLAYGTSHPQHLQVDETGTAPSQSQICPNSPYVRELLLPQICEILRYDVDGLFLDLLSIIAGRRVCMCPACAKEFSQTHPGELITCDLAELRKFRWEMIHRVCTAISRVRDDQAPDKFIIRNSAFLHDGDDDPGPGLTEPEDIGCGESQMMNTYIRPDYVTAALRPAGKPFMGIPVRFVYGWGEWTLKPLAQMNYENATLAAGGAVISHGDHLSADGTLEPAVMARLKKSYEFVAGREPFLSGTRAQNYAAILVRRNDIYWNRPLLGAARILADAQIPFDLLWMEDLNQLDKYRLLVVPDFAEDRRYPDQQGLLLYPLPVMTQAMQQGIASWVDKGGALFTEAGGFLKEGNPELGQSVCGVRVGKLEGTFGYLTGEPPWVPDALGGFSQQFRGARYDVPASTAKPVVQWKKGGAGQQDFGHYPPPDDSPAGGAVFLNRCGEGSTLYYSCPLFATYVETNHAWLKELVQLHLRAICADVPVVLAEALPSVRTYLRKNSEGVLFVHILYAHTEPATLLHAKSRVTPYPLIEQEYPLCSLNLFVRTPPPHSVTLEPGSVPVEWVTAEDGIRCRIPEIRTWNVLRIEPR